jgi:ubiquitin carboxyl-terminal hydrolase L3
LESSEELRSLYAAAAKEGSTEAPDAEEDVDFHYVCFVKPSTSSFIYELDGDRKGPKARGRPTSPEHDMLTGVGLQILRDTIDRENDLDGRFSLMALTLQ